MSSLWKRLLKYDYDVVCDKQTKWKWDVVDVSLRSHPYFNLRACIILYDMYVLLENLGPFQENKTVETF